MTSMFHRHNDFLLLVGSSANVEYLNPPEGQVPLAQKTTLYGTARLYGHSANFFEDEQTGSFLHLYGDVYDVDGTRGGYKGLLRSLLKQGPQAVAEMDGAFVLILFDSRNQALHVVTDRLGERQAFHAVEGSAQAVTNNLRLIPFAKDPDPTGVVWYLVNKTAYGGRTILQDVEVLERATVHSLTLPKTQKARYWHYRVASGDRKNLQMLSTELSHRLEAAAARRLRMDRPILLALSGGNDSTTLLGLARFALGRKDLETFSYAAALPPAEGGDAARAAQQSQLLKLKHHSVLRYNGDFNSWLEGNAALGDAASPSGDIHAIRELRQRFDGTQLPQVVLGDECFGMFDPKLTGPEDVLNTLYLHPVHSAPALLDLIPDDLLTPLTEEFCQDRMDILKRAEDYTNLSDQLDYLYLDQRLNHYLLPHREKFIGSCFPIVNPFLEQHLVEFMATIPRRFRRGRRLYLQTIRQMFPKLFALPRATVGEWSTDWTDQIVQNATEIKRHLRTNSSRLDPVLPPERIARLIDELGEPTAASTQGRTPRSVAAAILRRAKAAAGLSKKARPRVPILSPAELMRRILIIRRTMGGLPQ